MITYTIYQIDPDKDKNSDLFLDLDSLRQLRGADYVPRKLSYRPIYTGMACPASRETPSPMNFLESLYGRFNINPPEDYKGHSLSVSDVIQIEGSGESYNGFWFCDSIGWKKIDW